MDRSELFELAVAWLTLSIAFAWNIDQTTFFTTLPLYLIVVGTAFVFHELAHKYVSHYLGYPARFHMWTEGLVLAVALAIFTNGNFVFAAPGAVYVYGSPSERDNGLISLAGPMTNLLIAWLSLYTAYAVPPLYTILIPVAYVNTFLGVFNMLPIYPLDGSKVLAWSPTVYLLAMSMLVGTLFFLF